MESQARRRLHAVQCHLLPAYPTSNDPHSLVQPNFTAGKFVQGTPPFLYPYICVCVNLDFYVVLMRFKRINSWAMEAQCDQMNFGAVVEILAAVFHSFCKLVIVIFRPRFSVALED